MGASLVTSLIVIFAAFQIEADQLHLGRLCDSAHTKSPARISSDSMSSSEMSAAIPDKSMKEHMTTTIQHRKGPSSVGDVVRSSSMEVLTPMMAPTGPGLPAGGTIFSYAGGGRTSNASYVGQAASVAITVCGISLDTMTGNLYIADKLNNVIRMVTKSTGIITTVAGSGSSSSRGDGRLAVLALLSSPRDVAANPFNGDIYIAVGDTIRLVTKSTGIITTIAGKSNLRGYTGDGGLAVNSTLFFPQGIDNDPSTGDLYIADTANNAIRLITKSTGIITTIAGTDQYGYSGDGGLATLASLRKPRGVAVDASSGNVVIADTENNLIRMITKSTGIITTIAGTGSYDYSGDGGLATSASFNYPCGVAVDASSGNVVVADTYNYAIRMITKSTGIITTIAGTGNKGYKGDGGPAIHAELTWPQSVAFDTSTGTMYIADTGNNVVRNVVRTHASAPADTAPSGRTIAIVVGSVLGFFLLALIAVVYRCYGKPRREEVGTSTVPSPLIENENGNETADPEYVLRITGRDNC